ncbi:MAG: hypothetical protein HOJ79_14315 [Nitrospina sp.]|nr:hypothetical protein [Nitrospina sp.]
MDKGNTDHPEAYVSLLYNDMVADGLKIKVHEVPRFICLGTPEDYQQYHYWWNYFNSEQDFNKSPLPEKGIRVNLIPLAGQSRRFREFGYRAAKPLIRVRGTPMVIRSANSLPPADEWIFEARSEDLEKHPIEREIKKLNQSSTVLRVETETASQTATCLLAQKNIPDNAELMIAYCGCEQRYSLKKWEDLIGDLGIDGVVWTYRMNNLKLKDPSAFTYCKVMDDKLTIKEVVSKRAISSNPELDLLAIGVFWYRRADDFFKSAQHMLDKGGDAKGGCCVGATINELLDEGRHFVVFEVDQWIPFGSPFELQTLEYWEDIFHSSILNFRS